MSKAKSASAANNSQRKRQDDVFSYRILAALSFVIISVILLMQIKSGYDKANTIVVTDAALRLLGWLAPLAGAAMFIVSVILKKSRKNPVKLAGVLKWSGIIAVVFGVCAYYVAWTYAKSMTVLYILLPGLALLYVLYYIYPKEFFWLALFISGSALGLWFLCRLIQNTARHLPLPAGYSILIGAIVVFALALLWVQSGHGTLRLGKLKLKLLPEGSKYVFIWLAGAIVLALILLTILFGWIVAWYGIFVIFSYLFVLAVYYTVKIM